jgi:hypothetical protein
MICHRDDYGLRVERRTDVAVFAVWRENLHPRTGRHLDPRSFHESVSVEHGDVVFASHRHPDFLAIGREESFMGRAADIGGVLHRIGGGVDKSHGIAADRDDGDHLVIWREPHAVHEKLPLVERAEIAGLRVAETDHADELVVIRIGHRNGVRELLGGVDPVAMADWNIRVRCSARGLSGEGGGREKTGEQACERKKAAGHRVVSLRYRA